MDLRAWLSHHGATAASVNSAAIRAVYGADIAIDDAERGDRQARSGAQAKIALLRRRV